MTFEVEKNIPIPETRGACARYPFKDMEVGDSFTIPKSGHEGARQAARYWSARLPGSPRFTIRREGDGYRCWRFA